MKSFITCLLLFCTTLLGQRGLNTSTLNTQVITEAMIKSFGISRISEILNLAEKWNISTLDGSDVFFSANNLSPYQRQNILIFIDGQITDISIFDLQDLDLLPVSIDQVDYVEIVNTPIIYNGLFAQNGAFDIHTKKPSKGLSVQGQTTFADETGDPGPLSFTDYSSPNVDKLAQLFSVNINSSGEKWFLKGSVKHEENFKTDPAINARISNLNNDDNKSTLISYFFKISADALNGTHQFLAGLSSNRDFFFFKPYGNEIPVKQEFRHFGVNGNAAFGHFGINYSAKISLNQLGYLQNNRNIDFDFGLNNQFFNIEAYYSAPGLRGLFGIVHNRFNAVTSKELSDKNVIFNSFYFQGKVYKLKNLEQAFGIFVTRNYGETAAKGFLSGMLHMGKIGSVITSFSYAEELFPEDNSYWFWNERGYSVNVPAEFNRFEDFKSKKILTADAEYRFSKDSNYSFEAGLNFRSFSDFYIERQLFQYIPAEHIFTSITNINTSENLKTAGITTGISYSFTRNLSARLFYMYTKSIEGSDIFTEVWQTIPEHRAILSVYYQPVTALGASVRIKYYSATSWFDYRYVQEQSGQIYEMRIKPLILTDLSLNSWFWNRKIWISGTIRNLFNHNEVYHPAGANLNLRVYLQMQFYFNSVVE